MERALDRDTIMSVLGEGKNLASELKRKLDSRGGCEILVENILSSYENAIKLLLENGVPSPLAHVGRVFEVPSSIQGSPTSEGSDLTPKDQPHKCKKRKTFPKWSEQVRVRSEAGFEGQLDDGYNWRKYGQKDILGANHPRAYYRCTHRNTQGCLATKQVQRVDEEPSLFDVIYRGKHSCMQERLRQNTENNIDLVFFRKKGDEEESLIRPEGIVKEENQEMVVTKEDTFSSFSFPLTPVESEVQFFLETNYSPDLFLSPATSESYFSMSDCPMNDLAEIMSNKCPFPLGELDISIGQIDFSSQLLDYF